MVSECFLSFVLGTELLKLADWLLLIQSAQALWEVLTGKVSLFEVLLNISVELPDKDTVTLSNTDDLLIVSWVKNDIVNWIGVANKALEIVWNSFLGFIVPDLYHAILSTSQKVSRIVGDIYSINATPMNICDLSQKDTLVFDQAVEFNFAILGNNQEVSIIVGKLE